jgi:peptidoglycan/LPS O-acetylase OafA/YrhL
MCVGSILLLFSLENFAPLQTPFATPLVQYLGDISFSLYLLHYPMIFTIGQPLTVWLIESIGVQSIGFVLGGLLLTPVLICVSDVHWRLVDENSLKLTRWIFARMSSGR